MSFSPILTLLFAFSLIICAEAVRVRLTVYKLVQEKDYPDSQKQSILTCDNKEIAKVSRRFARLLADEGSGLLQNGRTFVNLRCCNGTKNPTRWNCYAVTRCPMGLKNCLDPFVTIAVKDNFFPQDSTVYIKELDNLTLPSGEKHNGCVRVGDDCGSCSNRQWVDWYVYSEKNEKSIKLPSHVDATRRSCSVRKYKTG